MQRLFRFAAAAALLAFAGSVVAHDASAWGGLFRSRDDGRAWLSADAGLFVGAALALAVSPTDPNHLLYATDTRLLVSHNAGRDWVAQAPQLFNGPTLAVTFSNDGRRAWAATPAGVFVADEAAHWTMSEVPAAAIPGHALTPGLATGRAYLLGARGLYASSDDGSKFARIGQDDLPDVAGSALLVLRVPNETLFAVFAGRVWVSTDGGGKWRPSDAGLPQDQVQTLAADRDQRNRLWAASGNQVHVSDDLGASWRRWGLPIGAGTFTIHGLAAVQSGAGIVITTHKGLLRSTDAGATWAQVEGALPLHLEAGPVVADPHDSQTLYAGFSLVPYAELRRRAAQGSNLLSQLDPVSVAGAGAFLLLLLIGGGWAARRLAYSSRNP
ncbi:MAG: hypothetical protein ABL900_15800 [Burkholderiaceae bacterium]